MKKLILTIFGCLIFLISSVPALADSGSDELNEILSASFDSTLSLFLKNEGKILRAQITFDGKVNSLDPDNTSAYEHFKISAYLYPDQMRIDADLEILALQGNTKGVYSSGFVKLNSLSLTNSDRSNMSPVDEELLGKWILLPSEVLDTGEQSDYESSSEAEIVDLVSHQTGVPSELLSHIVAIIKEGNVFKTVKNPLTYNDLTAYRFFVNKVALRRCLSKIYDAFDGYDEFAPDKDEYSLLSRKILRYFHLKGSYYIDEVNNFFRGVDFLVSINDEDRFRMKLYGKIMLDDINADIQIEAPEEYIEEENPFSVY